MRREQTLEEISDGKLYDSNDMVKADCHDCEGCCDCCQGMGDSVLLDPYDVYRLSTGVKEQCIFLNSEGRCHIHSIRPGFCRLFPLGRLYENGSFKYILQIHECPKTNRSKIKVKKWVDTPDLKNYEKLVNDWHYFLLDVQEVLYNAEDPNLIRNLNLFVVNRFYLKPYDQKQDFYIQFYERLKEGKELLALA